MSNRNSASVRRTRGALSSAWKFLPLFTVSLLPSFLSGQSTSLQDLLSTGTGSFLGAGVGTYGASSEIARQEHDRDFHNSRLPRPSSAPGSAADPVSLSVLPASPGFGFIGISHRDQRLAGTGKYANTQFSLEPPDQGFCVGNGYAVEAVNTALRVYSASSGAPLTGVLALNQFFGLTPEINRTTRAYGDFTSDPKCLYDSGTGRFFLTILQVDVDPSTGNFTGPSSVRIAVSQTSDPTGNWNLFKLDTTDDGTNGTMKNANCPCLGDQPLIGLNDDGFFISTNEFPQFTAGFNGAQVYGVTKERLLGNSGNLSKVVHINVGSIPAPDGGVWYSLQPANAPPNAPAGKGQLKNTEFFVSALDFTGTLDNRVAVWGLTNSSALASGTPNAINFDYTLVSSETYGQPPNARQKPGPGNFQPQLLNTNDDRMNQVVYANGNLYSAVNTVLGSGPTLRAGIAYFVIAPSIQGHLVSASMTNQGYVSVAGGDVFYPSIGVNNIGKGVMGFTLSGPQRYPSSAFATVSASAAAGPVTVSHEGVAPEDGFTALFANGVSRWGDYSASYADEHGDIWIATESIPSTSRTFLANWGTYINRVTP